MAKYIKTMLDSFGNTIFPRTRDNAVTMSDGTTPLKTYIDNKIVVNSVITNTVENTVPASVAITSEIDGQNYVLNIPKGADGYTPIKGVDYFDGVNTSATDVTSVPMGKITATNVQGALNELDSSLTSMENQTDLTVENQLRQTNSYASKPIVVFTLDDGATEDLTLIKPLFESYGYKATSYIVTNVMGTTTAKGTHMVSEQLQELSQAGFEIGAHTLDHTALADTLTEAEIINQMVGSKLALNKLGFISNNFAYPSGVAPARTQKIARKYFRSATLYNSNQSINKMPINKTAMYRIALGSWFDGTNATYPITDTFNDYYKVFIDRAVNENGLCIFALHPYQMRDNAVQKQYLIDTLNYCQANNIAVMTMDKALDYYDNVIDLITYNEDNTVKNYVKLGVDGMLYSNIYRPSTIIDVNKFSNDTIANDYPLSQISRMGITNAGTKGFPYGNCDVYTDKPTIYNNPVKQWCYDKYTNNVKFRATDVDGVWTAWIEYAIKKQSTALKTPLSYLGGTITLTAGSRGDYSLLDSVSSKNDNVIVTFTKPLPLGIVAHTYIRDDLKVRLLLDNLKSTSISFLYSDIQMNIYVL